MIDNLIAGLKDLNPERELIVSSFNHLALTEFKRRSPETQVASLFFEIDTLILPRAQIVGQAAPKCVQEPQCYACS